MDYHLFRDLRLDVGHAFRAFRRSPGFAALVTLILALGIGTSTAVFSVVNGVLLRPLPYDHPERIAYLWQSWNGIEGRVNVSVPELRDYEAGATSLEAVGGFVTAGTSLGDSLQPERIEMALVTPGFFEVFQVRPTVGRVFSAEEAQVPFAVYGLLSDRLWRQNFGGEPGIVGSTVLIGGRRVDVVGIMPPRFDFPRGVDIWRPLVLSGGVAQDRSRRFIDVVVRTKPGVTMAAVGTDVQAAEQRVPEHAVDVTTLVPLQDEMVGPVRDALTLLLGAVGLVLLIACANVANLLLARATGREREMAVRAALGASRSRLFRQLLAESFTLALAGAVAGLGMAALGMAALRRFGAGRIPRLEEISLDAPVLGFTVLASLLTGALFGLAPALSAVRAAVSGVLKGARGTAARRTRRARSVLVVAELALALVLAVGASLLIRSFTRLRGVELGFREDHLLTFQVGLPFAVYPEREQRIRFFDELLARLRTLPGVALGGATSILPVSGENASSSAIAEGRQTEVRFPEADVRTVTPGYLESLEVPLLRGRMLEERDGADSAHRVALVNRALAEALWPGQDPLGRRFSVNAPPDRPEWREVVGVVVDIRHGRLEAPPRVAMYEPHRASGDGTMALVLRTGSDPVEAVPAVRAAVRALDPTLPVYAVRTMEEHLGESLAVRRFHVFLVGMFSVVAICLAGAGLYGVLAYTVGQRTVEIGVRMALGARRDQVVWMMVGEGVLLAALGIVIGAAGAFAATRAIAGLLYGVSPADPAAFIGTAGLLLLVAVAASWIPARRAARIQPVTALRYE